MSHHGPYYETHDVTFWTGEQLAEWLIANPAWFQATIESCSCDICGDVTELVRKLDSDTLTDIAQLQPQPSVATSAAGNRAQGRSRQSASAVLVSLQPQPHNRKPVPDLPAGAVKPGFDPRRDLRVVP